MQLSQTVATNPHTIICLRISSTPFASRKQAQFLRQASCQCQKPCVFPPPVPVNFSCPCQSQWQPGLTGRSLSSP